MEVIAERLGTNLELTRDVDWALPVGEVAEHLMLLLRQRVHRGRPQRIVRDLHQFLRHQEHTLDERLLVLSAFDTARQMHDSAPSALRILVNQGRHVYPDSQAGAGIDLEIKVGDCRVMRRAIAHMTILCADERAQHATALEQLKAGLADRLVASKPEERLGTGIPGANLAAVGDRECRISGMLEEVEEIAVKHRGHPEFFKYTAEELEAGSAHPPDVLLRIRR